MITSNMSVSQERVGPFLYSEHRERGVSTTQSMVFG